MKKILNKENVKLLINLGCIAIIVILYLLSSLLNIIFNKWLVIIGSVVVVGLILITNLFNDKEKIKKVFSTINEYIQVLLIAIILVEIIFTFIMFPATVSQNSMYPTLYPSDQLIIKCTNHFENNDIVVFKYDSKIQKDNIGVVDGELLIKRVIAIPGQTFNYVGTNLYIDGVLVEDKFAVSEMDGLDLEDICKLNGMYDACLQEDGSFKIPEGWYVVFGDNRQYSSTLSKVPLSIDSRTFGLVHESQIFGTAEYKIESLFKWQKIN